MDGSLVRESMAALWQATNRHALTRSQRQGGTLFMLLRVYINMCVCCCDTFAYLLLLLSLLVLLHFTIISIIYELALMRLGIETVAGG